MILIDIGIEHVNGRFAGGGVKAFAQRLAVNGDVLLLGTRTDQAMDPLLNPQFKRIRIEDAKDLAEGVVRRNAARQIQKGLKPVLVGFGKILNLGPVFQTAASA